MQTWNKIWARGISITMVDFPFDNFFWSWAMGGDCNGFLFHANFYPELLILGFLIKKFSHKKKISNRLKPTIKNSRKI
jgi:hypothetical protein